MAKPELIAPAGNLESLFAAFQYGADSVYLGLGTLNARASARNFSLEELEFCINYAHQHNKKIYIAFNILIKASEIETSFNILSQIARLHIDGIIIQDLGIYKIIKNYFTAIPIHLSTQMTIHNLTGIKIAEKMGIKRVILARELTLQEIGYIRQNTQIELEVFIQGACCYSYSGLCLFSSFIGGRSGNRGWCAQPCRKLYTTGDGKSGYFFSMRDLFTLKDIPLLKVMGINAVKIEGRLKNPLYAAYTSSIYRKAIDGEKVDEIEAEKILKTIFSRRTRLFLQKQIGEINTDTSYPGHLGLHIGKVLETQNKHITFITETPLEKYDGIKIIDLKTKRDIGFSLRDIKIKGKTVFQTEKNTKLNISIPHPVSIGSDIYLSSRRNLIDTYPIKIPLIKKPKIPIKLDVVITANEITISYENYKKSYSVKTTKSKTQGLNQQLLLKYFSRLGETPFILDKIKTNIPPNIFIPPKELNQIRRSFFKELENHLSNSFGNKAIINLFSELKISQTGSPINTNCRRFTIKIDNPIYIGYVATEADRLIMELSPAILDDFSKIIDKIKKLDKPIIFSLPSVIREKDIALYKDKINYLLYLSYNQFQISNLGGLDLFNNRNVVLYADFPLYIFNTFSLITLHNLGICEGTLSPELNKSELDYIIPLARNKVDIILYSDIPYFYSANCLWASIYKKCPSQKKCNIDNLQLKNNEGDKFLTLCRKTNYCTTIFINEKPFSWAQYLDYFLKLGQCNFRIDFLYRDYTPEQILQIIRSNKNGDEIKGTMPGNFRRKLQ